jgi:pimeloyl-ACP methyl ester carboxylesterase
MADYQEGRAKTGPLTLHYLEWGSGPRTLVALHGTSMSANAWTRLARDLQSDFRIVALNMRGHGLSDAPKTGYSVAEYGADLLGFLDSMALTRVDLIGSSLGTQVAIDFASRYPERVNRIVLSDPSLAIEATAIAGYVRLHETRPRTFGTWNEAIAFCRALPQRARLEPEMHALTEAGDFRQLPDGRYEWRYNLDGILQTFHKLSIDQWDQVRCIEAPTLVLRAATSHVLSKANALKLERELKNGVLYEVCNSSHTIRGDQPALLSDLTHLSQRRAGGAP